MTNIKFSELSPAGALSDADIFAVTQTLEDGSKVSRSATLGILTKQIAGDKVAYKGTWQSGTTYQFGDEVSETVNGIPGTFICLAETSSAEPSSSSDWRRISGNASDVDGVSAGSNGRIEYNRVASVSTTPFKPNFNGELSWTLNINASTEIDLSMLTNTLFNTNPAATLRLVITASEAVNITFTGSDNYWLADGSYGAEPPVFNLDASQPMTIVEVINLTNTAAPGVRIQQTYPAVKTSENSVTIIPSGDVFDPLTAEPGIYYLGEGAILHNGPGSGIVEMYTALVSVRIKGVSVNLIVSAHFNQSSGYHHCGEYELMASSTSGGAPLWSSLGPGDSSNPAAGSTYTMVSNVGGALSTVAVVQHDKFTTLLAGKAYGLLSDTEDQTLKVMTEEAIDALRFNEKQEKEKLEGKL